MYHLQQAYDSATAKTEAEALVAMERFFTLPSILFTHYSISDNVEDTDAYFTYPLNVFGQSGATGDQAPLFNTLRIDFTKLGGGRPGRKYYRGALTESVVQAFGRLDPAWYAQLVTQIQTTMDANTAGGENFTYVSASAHPFVAMRQLRRGSKKKNIPSPPTTP